MSHTIRILITRPDFRTLPAWKLPVYPRSAGLSEYHEGDIQDSTPRPFVQLNWCLSGRGDVIQEGKEFQIEPGGVWFTPPGLRCFTRQREGVLRIRWITFDGPDAERFLDGYG